MIFVFEWVENIVGKGENAGYQHSFSHNVFKRIFTQGHTKSGLSGNELIRLQMISIKVRVYVGGIRDNIHSFFCEVFRNILGLLKSALFGSGLTLTFTRITTVSPPWVTTVYRRTLLALAVYQSSRASTNLTDISRGGHFLSIEILSSSVQTAAVFTNRATCVRVKHRTVTTHTRTGDGFSSTDDTAVLNITMLAAT